MKEIQDLIDALPYWLLFVLPLFIALSPYSPCDASELHFPIHRLAQFEISGNRFGSKTAAISIEARSSNAASTNLLRKVVIAKLTGETSLFDSEAEERFISVSDTPSFNVKIS